MIVGGIRALLQQALHPVAMDGVAKNSNFREDAWGRLQRTGDYVSTLSFAPRKDAETLAARVRSVHTKLGLDDPHLLLWVHMSLVDSFVDVALRSGLALAPQDLDQYVLEMLTFAELVGINADSVPKNMGPGINTAGNELFPSTTYNDSLFFFASDGHPGVGGLDIFKATITTSTKETVKKWGNVQNMLKPINSASNDYAMSIRKDLKSGFFTSERSNPKNRTYTPDIYSFSTPPVSFDLTVIVSEVGSKKKIEGAKVVVNELTGAN